MSRWDYLGIYLGYPKCCIADFKHRRATGYKLSANPKRKLCGTGYVPCEACNKLPVEQLKATIAQNRICERPFPNAPVGNKVLEAIKKHFGIGFEDLEKVESI